MVDELYRAPATSASEGAKGVELVRSGLVVRGDSRVQPGPKGANLSFHEVILHTAMQDVKRLSRGEVVQLLRMGFVATPRTTDELLRLAARTFGRLGGRARAKALSAERRKAIARKAAEARARALSPEQRSSIASNAARARIAKGKSKKRTGG